MHTILSCGAPFSESGLVSSTCSASGDVSSTVWLVNAILSHVDSKDSATILLDLVVAAVRSETAIVVDAEAELVDGGFKYRGAGSGVRKAGSGGQSGNVPLPH